ncbi:hypothetical protein NP233_g2453 [Leucocoprinus birnbaumii]|uniref:Uncharacterized protein n=1 Tax=Leucocoprinus birnbaumii TaxID=56174 RepID=A0AAD5W2A0_9AGAR|nr:hypothetical protein NP233_g2453 [Leucocoprinus birnbaumii]
MKFLWGNKKEKGEESDEKKTEDLEKKNEGQDQKTEGTDEKEKKEPELPPVSFFKMFMFSTPFEIMIDVVGLVTAAAAGAAQPILALLFGTLANNFVNFARTVELFKIGQATQADLDAAASDFRSSSSKNALYFVYTGIVVWACTWFYVYGWSYTSETNSKRIREAYLKATLRQDVEYFDEVGAGEVATRIQSDTHLVQQGISEKVPMTLQFIGSFIAGMIIGYTQCWQLALAMCSIFPCISLTGALMGKFMTRYTQLSLDGIGSAGSIAEESISTIRTAKAFGIQSHLGALFDDKVSGASRNDMKLALVQGFGFAAFFFISYAAYGLAFSFGTTLINQGIANAGQVITVFMSIFIGSFSLTIVAPQVVAITTARGAAAKLFATIERIPPIDSSSPSGEKPSSVNGTIILDNVTFSYPSRPSIQVLKHVSMSFTAGKSYALVGPSGSGKSTIVALLERFYDPKEGNISLDGMDLTQLNVKWLRQQIGLVSQEPVLFGTTVRENVLFGLAGSKYDNDSTTEEEKFKLIKEACKKANAHDFIMRLPKGYDTLVGERGFMLSGGQKQRVAIARAIVSDPRVLVLDEATSALDTRSEEVVQDALARASEGRTTIAIAHRLSTIKNSDKIYVMTSGEVVEQGSHDELMSLQGTYSRLVEAQNLKKQTGGLPTGGENTPIPRAPSEEDIKERSKGAELARRVSSVYEKESLKQVDIEVGGEEVKEKKYSAFYLAMRMGAIVKDEWLKFLLGSIFSIIVGLIYPAFGIVYSFAIEGFSSPDPHVRRVQGDRNALWFFIIAIGYAVTMGFQNYFFSTAAATLTLRLRKLSFRAVMRQDVEFFDNEKNTSGVLTARINGDPKKVNGLAGTTLGTIIQGIATIAAGVIAGLAIVWKVGLVGLACMPVLLTVGYTSLIVVMQKDANNKEAHAQSAQIACESAAAIRTVASLTREDGCVAKYSQSLGVPLQRAIKAGFVRTGLFAASQSSMFFVIALIFWYGSVLFSRLEISIFQLFVGLMATTLGAMQAGGMFQFSPDISAAKTAASDIIALLDSPSAIESDVAEPRQHHEKDSKRIEGKIEARDIRFSYPTRPNLPVLKGISFSVEPSQYVAFVGASGSGKSTIVQLIQRFYDLDSGAICIDGQPLTDLALSEYRKDVALVSQEPTLYSGSLRFNILLGATKPHSEVTQEQLEEACRKANILDFIKDLPDGFETAVGNKGSQLSGGQKQRIAIARALIRNPKILLLDEATSALDSASEKVVQAALDEAAKGRTTIAIAHRLSTIQDADKIFFIKNGNISESGTHNELLALRGDYHDYAEKKGHRLRSLDLRVNAVRWHHVVLWTIDSDDEFPLLETLSLWISSPDPSDPVLTVPLWSACCPNLRNLILADPAYDIYHGFRTHQITALSIEGLHPDHAIYILSEFASSVIEFSVGDIALNQNLPSSIPTPPAIQFCHRSQPRKFSWEPRGYSHIGPVTCIHLLKAPGVQRVSWGIFDEPGLSSSWLSSWTGFFQEMEQLKLITFDFDLEPELTLELLTALSFQSVQGIEVIIRNPAELNGCLKPFKCPGDAGSERSAYPCWEILDIWIQASDISPEEALKKLSAAMEVFRSRRPPRLLPSCIPIRHMRIRNYEMEFKNLVEKLLAMYPDFDVKASLSTEVLVVIFTLVCVPNPLWCSGEHQHPPVILTSGTAILHLCEQIFLKLSNQIRILDLDINADVWGAIAAHSRYSQSLSVEDLSLRITGLETIHPNHAMYILSQCVNVVDVFALADLSDHWYLPESVPTPVLSGSVVLPRLSSFAWQECDGTVTRENWEIHLIHAPAVRHLAWSISSQDYDMLSS